MSANNMPTIGLEDFILSLFKMQRCSHCRIIYPRGNPYKRQKCHKCDMRIWRRNKNARQI